MHIFEGFLPSPWWQLWWVLSIPVIMFGMYRLNKLAKENREIVPLLAVAGAFIFIISSLKLPSVTGSTSHPTGTGIAAILFGAPITAVLSSIVLLYQAIFLAHGGITTFGANVMSMGIIGPVLAVIVYKACMKANINFYIAVFLASTVADWGTYIVTSFQLALAFPTGLEFTLANVMTSAAGFLGVFAITQIPLAIMEGALTTVLFKYVLIAKSNVMVKLNVITQDRADKLTTEATA